MLPLRRFATFFTTAAGSNVAFWSRDAAEANFKANLRENMRTKQQNRDSPCSSMVTSVLASLFTLCILISIPSSSLTYPLMVDESLLSGFLLIGVEVFDSGRS